MAFEDTFTRADADTLGSPWVHLDGQSLGSKFGIRSGEARYLGPLDTAPALSGSDYYSTQLVTVDVGSADMAVEWNVEGPSSGGVLYLPFRYATGTSPTWLNNTLGLYATGSDPGKLYLLAGDSTNLGSFTVSGWRSGDTIRAEAVGTAIKIYIGGVLKLSATSSVGLSNTRAGIGGHAGSVFVDQYAMFRSGSAIATVDLGTDIQTVEWDLAASVNYGMFFDIFRYKDANNFWFVCGSSSDHTKMYLFRRLGGTDTLMATASGVTWGPGHDVRVEAGASSIIVKLDGVTKITHSTTAPGSAWSRAGMLSGDARNRFERFAGNAFTDNFTREYASTLGSPWTESSWGIGYTLSRWSGVSRDGLLDYARWTRFWCSPWPLNRGFRNLGLTRGARSVT